MATHTTAGAARKTCRRLLRAAMFAAVRGLAYSLGAAASGWLLWWLASR